MDGFNVHMDLQKFVFCIPCVNQVNEQNTNRYLGQNQLSRDTNVQGWYMGLEQTRHPHRQWSEKSHIYKWTEHTQGLYDYKVLSR